MLTKRSLTRIGAFVALRHSEFQDRDDALCRPDPEKIGPMAERLFKSWALQAHDGYDEEDCLLAHACGLLLYSAHYGAQFEEINDLGGVQLASMVAQLSPDLRLPRSRREQMLIGSIGSAEPVCQIAKLAELLLWGDGLHARARSKSQHPKPDREFMKSWALYGGNMLDALYSIQVPDIERLCNALCAKLREIRKLSGERQRIYKKSPAA